MKKKSKMTFPLLQYQTLNNGSNIIFLTLLLIMRERKMRQQKYILLGLFVCVMMLGFTNPVKATVTKEVEPYEDSYVRAYNPIDNFGSSDYTNIGADLWGYQEETFLKFLIPTVETEIIRVSISSYWYSFMCETPLSVSACIVSNSWNEYTITWNNKPSRGTILDTDFALGDGEYFNIEISLTHIIQGSILSVCIYENAPYKPDGLQGGSREGGYKVPELIVEYETPPIMIIAPIIVGVVVVVIVGVVAYSKINKKKKRRLNLENANYVKNVKCSKCGNIQHSNETKFCSECGQKLK